MSYGYGPLAAKAVTLIAKYGKTVTLERATSANPADANKPWRGPVQAAPLTRTPKGLVASWEKNEIDGEHIRATDIKLLVAGQDAQLVGVDIERFTIATVDTVAYGCTNVNPVKPGDTVLLYTLRLRL